MKTPTSIELWLADWAQQDYSWATLGSRRVPGLGVTLADFWRRNSTGNYRSGEEPLRSDAQLIEEGLLIDCGDRGLFHIAYLPPNWINELSEKDPSIADHTDSLAKAWSEVFKFSSTRMPTVYSGVFLNAEAATRLSSMKNLSFIDCCFLDDFSINIIDGKIEFKKSCFLGELKSSGFGFAEGNSKLLKFDKCKFFGEMTFEDGEFGAGFILEECDFHGSLEISQATFLQAVRIDQCCFYSRFSFSRSRTSNRFSVFGSEFFGNLELYDSRFGGEVSFNESTLHRDVDIVACHFADRARFGDVEWPDMNLNRAIGSETHFSSDVAFVSQGRPPIQLFDGIQFAGSVTFSGGQEKQWITAFDCELLAIREGFAKQSLPTEMRQLEGGCRTLRKLAAANGDVHLEHQWHRCELIARRNGRDISIIERTLSTAYGFCADYGLSISRPFFILVMICIFFAITYASMHSGIRFYSDVDWKSLTEGFGYSFNRALPIGVFEFSDSAWRKELLGSADTWSSIAVRAIATFQTIVSVILIYLGVMAARRKFKIS